MSSFEIAKETMMLVITAFVLVFVSVMFFIFLGNFKVGSNIDVSDEEARLVALRVVNCLDSEKLEECIKTNKYGIKIDGKLYVNEQLYETLLKSWDWDPSSNIMRGELIGFGKIHPSVEVIFEK